MNHPIKKESFGKSITKYYTNSNHFNWRMTDGLSNFNLKFVNFKVKRKF